MTKNFSKERMLWSAKVALVFIVVLKVITLGASVVSGLKYGVGLDEI